MSIRSRIRENVPLAPLTTFGVGGSARYFATVEDENDLWEIHQVAAEDLRVRIFFLGGGSNLLVRDEGFDGLVVLMKNRGITDLSEGAFDVGAGEAWDTFVAFAIDRGYAGIECMAGIPGSVGGTPVQNVGAYGQEVSEVISSVRVLDRRTGLFADLDREACRFRYRESIFNTDEPGRYVVTRVRFQLRPGGAPTLKYGDLQRHFGPGASPSLAEVAAAVREIRRSKGMLIVPNDPDCRSAGSYFKNPIVDAAQLSAVASAAGLAIEAVPHWPTGEGRIKLPAAWLLEKAGFVKGFRDGAVGISSRHTLALVNLGGATFADVMRLEARIVETVGESFGITLVREPVVLG